MFKFLKNEYIQAILVFVAIVGSYALYVNLTFEPASDSQADAPVPLREHSDTLESASNMLTGEVGSVQDLSGIHIMPDGSVMLGSGEVLEDATVLSDGTIELGSGATVTPVVDMRQ